MLIAVCLLKVEDILPTLKLSHHMMLYMLVARSKEKKYVVKALLIMNHDDSSRAQSLLGFRFLFTVLTIIPKYS